MAADIDELQIKIAADSQSASENVLALAGSLESLATSAIAATEPLKNFSQALNSLKGFKATGITQTADDLSKAFGQFNNIGTIDNTVQIIDSIENLRDAMSGLSDISANTKEFKVGKGFTSNIEQLATALPKLSGVGNVSDSVAVLDSVENLEQATSGLRNISENIRSLKIGTSFDKNLEQLSLAMAHLNEIGDTSAFAGGVEAISQSIERLNNIEIGQGFINLVQASSQWADALSKLNDIKLGTNFSEGIARIARAAEILNDVDFSGFKRMNDALASLPDNVRISFGASSTEVQELTEHLVNLNNTVQSIQTNMPQRRQRNTDTSGTGTNAPAIEKPDYSWSNDEIKGTLERASAFNKEVSDIKKVLAAYETMGEQVPESVIRAAESLGVFNNAMDETGAKASSFRDALKDASRAVATGAFKALGAEIKLVMSPLTAIGRKFKAASEKAGQFISSIKRIAMYRAIRSILKAITEGFEEGRKNLYYYSQAVGTDFAPSMDKAATAALYFKNSIGAATAPLTNYLVPMIDKAVDHIVELINKFNELTAVLTKQSTWTKAIKYPTTWQDSLEDAEKSAKKLKSTMLGFDELNIIELSEPTVKKNGFDAEDYSKMFEEVKTDMTVGSKIPELLMPIKLAWDSQGDKTLKTIKNTWSEILDLIGAVGNSFRKVWTNGTGQKSLELILEIVQNIVGTFGELASGIRRAWEENETGTRIIQATWDIANNLLTVFRDIWGSLREWASGLNWSPLFNAIADLGEAFEKLTDPNGGLAKISKTVITDFFEPLGKTLIENALPAAIDVLSTAFEGLAKSFEILEPFISPVVTGLGKFADFNFSAISGLASSLTAVIDILMGKEVDNKKVDLITSVENKLVDIMGGKDSWYGKLATAMEHFGSHELGDVLDEYKQWNVTYQGLIKIATQMKKSGGKLSLTDDVLNGDTDISELVKQYKKDVQNEMQNSQETAASMPMFAQIEINESDIERMSEEAMKSLDSIISQKRDSIELYGGERSGGLIDNFRTLQSVANETYQAIEESAKTASETMKNSFQDSIDSMHGKWQEFADSFGEIDDLDDSFESFSESWSEMWDEIIESTESSIQIIRDDWNRFFASAERTASGIWTKITRAFRLGFNDISSMLSKFCKNWDNSFERIQKTSINEWNSISITLVSSWDVWGGYVNAYASLWYKAFALIKDTVYNGWKYVYDRLSNTFNWGNIVSFVTDYPNLWQSGMGTVKKVVGDAVENIGKSFNSLPTISSIIGNINESDFYNAGANAVTWIKNGFDNVYHSTLGASVLGHIQNIKGAFSSSDFEQSGRNILYGIELGLEDNGLKNGILDSIDALGQAVTQRWNEWIDALYAGDDVHISDLVRVARGYASGGFVTQGELFVAREAGPELVGRIGSQTAVANNDQIVSAVSNGVYNAMLSAMSQTGKSVDSGKNEIHIYLDRQEITAQVEQQQRDNGVSIMSGLVYT